MDFTHNSDNSQTGAENDPELKAFIYQHLVDLQPYLSPESQIAVLLPQSEFATFGDEDEETEESLSLVATLDEYRLEAHGHGEDLYDAFLDAKKKMLEQLEEWFLSSVDSSERENEIQAVIEGRHLLH